MADWLKRRAGQPSARQGYRDDNVRAGQQLGPGLGQPPRKQAARVVTVAKLQVMHQLAHDTVKACHGAGAIVVGRVGRGCGGNHRAADIEGQRDAEASAQRSADEIDVRPAAWAYGVVRGERPVTSKA